jgi:hypothetical protein
MAFYDTPDIPCSSKAPQGTICYGLTNKCTPIPNVQPVCTENKEEYESGGWNSIGCIGGGCGG